MVAVFSHKSSTAGDKASFAADLDKGAYLLSWAAGEH